MLSVLFYLTVFALIFVIQLFAMKQKNKVLKRILIALSFLILLLLMGLRYRVGTDYVGYEGIYKGYSNSSLNEIWQGKGDVGKKLIIGSIAINHIDITVIFWIYGLLTLYPLFKINKNHKYKYLAYFTLVFNLAILPVCLNSMRQGAAMAFLLLAFDYFRIGSKKMRAIFCIVIAVLLHTSALFVAPYLLCYYLSKKHGRSFKLLSSILTIIASISFATFLKGLLADFGFSDYDYQLVIMNSVSFSLNIVVCDVIFYLMLILLFFMNTNHKANNDLDKKDAADMTCLLVDGSVYNIVGTMTHYLSRISYYFSMFQIILIPELLQNIPNKNTRIIAKMLCVSVLVVLFIFRCYILGYYGIMPYQSWITLG